MSSLILLSRQLRVRVVPSFSDYPYQKFQEGCKVNHYFRKPLLRSYLPKISRKAVRVYYIYENPFSNLPYPIKSLKEEVRVERDFSLLPLPKNSKKNVRSDFRLRAPPSLRHFPYSYKTRGESAFLLFKPALFLKFGNGLNTVTHM